MIGDTHDKNIYPCGIVSPPPIGRSSPLPKPPTHGPKPTSLQRPSSLPSGNRSHQRHDSSGGRAKTGPEIPLAAHVSGKHAGRRRAAAMPRRLLEHMDIWRRICDDSSQLKEYGIDHLEDWLETPLDNCRATRAKSSSTLLAALYRELIEQAVRREHCNWDMPLGKATCSRYLLPEVQEFRNMARIIALRAGCKSRMGNMPTP